MKFITKYINNYKKKNIEIKWLSFEVTRRCNMNCAHCFCGESQNVDISEKIIERALKNVKKVDTLYLAGGEVSLNVKAIESIFKYMKKENIQLDKFVLNINSKEYSQELITILDKAYYNFVLKPSLCRMAISTDQYHEINNDVCNKYIYDINMVPRPYYAPCGDKEIKILKRQGRATNFPLEGTTSRMDVPSLYKNNNIIYGVLLINAYGDIINGQEFSYEIQGIIKMGNVLKKDLIDIIPEKASVAERKIIFVNDDCHIYHTKYDEKYILEYDSCKTCRLGFDEYMRQKVKYIHSTTTNQTNKQIEKEINTKDTKKPINSSYSSGCSNRSYRSGCQ